MRIPALCAALLLLAGCGGGGQAKSVDPSGDIVFVRQDGDRNFLSSISSSGGTAERLVEIPGILGQLSPDLTRVAYVRSGETDSFADVTTWVMNVDGSEPHYVARGSSPKWSPNGTQLGVLDEGGVSTVELKSERTRRVYLGPATTIEWSPDGAKLAIASLDGLFVIRLRDLERQRLVDFIVHGLAWSQRDDSLVYARSLTTRAAPLGSSSLFVRTEDGRIRRLTRGGDDSQPSWSPDGESLVFVRGSPPGGDALEFFESLDERARQQELLVLDFSTGALRRLTDDEYRGESPRWVTQTR